jgi:hypothetical protein
VRDDVLSLFIIFERTQDVYEVEFTGTELTDAPQVESGDGAAAGEDQGRGVRGTPANSSHS